MGYNYMVVFFVSDKTFDSICHKDVIKKPNDFESQILCNEGKIWLTVDYNCVHEKALLMQCCSDQKMANRISDYCATLKGEKRLSFKKILLKIPRVESEARLKLTPVKQLETEDTTDDDNTIVSSSPVKLPVYNI